MGIRLYNKMPTRIKQFNETLNALNSKLTVGGIFFILKRPLTA